jgi:hypothetical protein
LAEEAELVALEKAVAEVVQPEYKQHQEQFRF